MLIYTWAFFVSFGEAMMRLSPVLLFLVSLIIANGLAIGRIERWSLGDSVYHAFINATTVGYGDFRPTRGHSKVLAVLNAFLGLLFTGIFVGSGVYAVDSVFGLPR